VKREKNEERVIGSAIVVVRRCGLLHMTSTAVNEHEIVEEQEQQEATQDWHAAHYQIYSPAQPETETENLNGPQRDASRGKRTYGASSAKPSSTSQGHTASSPPPLPPLPLATVSTSGRTSPQTSGNMQLHHQRVVTPDPRADVESEPPPLPDEHDRLRSRASSTSSVAQNSGSRTASPPLPPLPQPIPPLSPNASADLTHHSAPQRHSQPPHLQAINQLPLGCLISHYPVMRVVDVRNVSERPICVRLHRSLEGDSQERWKLKHDVSSDGDANATVSSGSHPSKPMLDVLNGHSEVMSIWVRNEQMFRTCNEDGVTIDESDAKKRTPTRPNTAGAHTPVPVSPPPLPSSVASSRVASASSSPVISSMRMPPSFSPPLPALSPPTTRAVTPIPISIPMHMPTPASLLPHSPSLPVSSSLVSCWRRFESACVTHEHTARRINFKDHAEEREYVKQFIMQRKDIETVIKEKLITRIDDNTRHPNREIFASLTTAADIHLEPFTCRRIYILFHIGSHLPKPTWNVHAHTQPHKHAPFRHHAHSSSPVPRPDAPAAEVQSAHISPIPRSQPLVLGGRMIAPVGVQPIPTRMDTPPALGVLPSGSDGEAAFPTSPPPRLPSRQPSDSTAAHDATRSDPLLQLWFQLVETSQSTPSAVHSRIPSLNLEGDVDPHSANNPDVGMRVPPLNLGGGISSTLNRLPSLCPPLRRFFFPASVCRSSLDVAQQHINLGQLLHMHVQKKTVAISNLSGVPLLYELVKTGSIASMDLTFPHGELGVIPPHQHADIPLIFKPSLAGKFIEPITVRNVLDSSNSKVVVVKAYLRKAEHFWLQALKLDFKPCCTPSNSHGGQKQTSNDTLIVAHSKPPILLHPLSLPSNKEGTPPLPPPQESPSPFLSPSLPLHPMRSLLSPTSPSVFSLHPIIIKNISLKPRTFRIQLVEWEKQCVKATNHSTRSDRGDGKRSASMTDTLDASTVLEGTNATALSSDVIVYTPAACPHPSLPFIPSLSLMLEGVSLSTGTSLAEREEEEEHIMHKLRIAIRKNKSDKVDKLRRRLKELQKIKQNVTHADESNGTQSDSASNLHRVVDLVSPDSSTTVQSTSHGSTSGLVFTLEPSAIQTIRATFVPRPLVVSHPADADTNQSNEPHTPTPPIPTPCPCTSPTASSQPSSPTSLIEFWTALLHVYETKNREVIKEVRCIIPLCSDAATLEDYITRPDRWAIKDEPKPARETEKQEREVQTQRQLAASNDVRQTAGSPVDELESDVLDTVSEASSTDASSLASSSVMLPRSPRSAPTAGVDEPEGASHSQMLRTRSLPAVNAVLHSEGTLDEDEDELSRDEALPLLDECADMPSDAQSIDRAEGHVSQLSQVPTLVQPAANEVGKQIGLLNNSAPSTPFTMLDYEGTHPTLNDSRNDSDRDELNIGTATSLTQPCRALLLLTSCTQLHKDLILPFDVIIPFEFSIAREMNDQEKCTPAAETVSPRQPSNEPSSFSLSPSVSGGFRVYWSEHIPLSMPAPTYFTLRSRATTPLILEINWIPNLQQRKHSYNISALPRSHSTLGGRRHRQRHDSAKMREDATPGGFLHCFVKPGTALLTHRHASASIHQDRTYSRSRGDSGDTLGRTPTPTTSIYVLLPAGGEIDIFMCWLASVSHPAAATHDQSFPRSSRSHSLRHSHSHEFGCRASTALHQTHGSARWRKVIDTAPSHVMQEAILMPTYLSTREADDRRQPDTADLSGRPSARSDPGVPATTDGLCSLFTSGSSSSSHSLHGDLSILPVGLPMMASHVDVEVCNLASSASTLSPSPARVSPLMLTPDRIHAGMVHMQANTGDGVDGKGVCGLNGIVRGRFLVANTMSKYGRARSFSTAGPTGRDQGSIDIVFGQQSKATLTSTFVPTHQRANFHFYPPRLSLAPGTRRFISFHCHVRALGQQTQTILVRDLTNHIDIALPVSFHAQERMALRFDRVKHGLFDAGLIDARRHPTQHLTAMHAVSKFVSFPITNPTRYPLDVLVSNNAPPSQLHIMDATANQTMLNCLTCLEQSNDCVLLTQTASQDRAASVKNQTGEFLRPRVLLPSRSTRHLILAFTPSARMDDGAHQFLTGLSFSVYRHRASPMTVHHTQTGPSSHPLLYPTHRPLRPMQGHTTLQHQTPSRLSIDDDGDEDDDVDEETEETGEGEDYTTGDSLSQSWKERDPPALITLDGCTLTPSHCLAELHVRLVGQIGMSQLDVVDASVAGVNAELSGRDAGLVMGPVSAGVSFIHCIRHQPLLSGDRKRTSLMSMTLSLRNRSPIIPLHLYLSSSCSLLDMQPHSLSLSPCHSTATVENGADPEAEHSIAIRISTAQTGLHQAFIDICTSQPDETEAVTPSSHADKGSRSIPMHPACVTIPRLLHRIYLRWLVCDGRLALSLSSPSSTQPSQTRACAVGAVEGSKTREDGSAIDRLNLGYMYTIQEQDGGGPPPTDNKQAESSTSRNDGNRTSSHDPFSFTKLANRRHARRQLLSRMAGTVTSDAGTLSDMDANKEIKHHPMDSSHERIAIGDSESDGHDRGNGVSMIGQDKESRRIRHNDQTMGSAVHMSLDAGQPTSFNGKGTAPSVSISSVNAIHRSIEVCNESSTPLFLTLSSDQARHISMRWCTQPAIPMSDDGVSDDNEYCPCGFSPPLVFFQPSVMESGDAEVELMYSTHSGEKDLSPTKTELSPSLLSPSDVESPLQALSSPRTDFDFCSSTSSSGELSAELTAALLQSSCGSENAPSASTCVEEDERTLTMPPPPAFTLQPCCPNAYCLLPGASVYAHITVALQEHRLQGEDVGAWGRGEGAEWESSVMVNSWTSSKVDGSVKLDSRGVSAAILLSATLCKSQSQWELGASVLRSRTCCSAVSVLPSLLSIYPSSLFASSFSHVWLDIGEVDAEAEAAITRHRIHNNNHAPLQLRIPINAIHPAVSLSFEAEDETQPMQPHTHASHVTCSAVDAIIPRMQSTSIPSPSPSTCVVSRGENFVDLCVPPRSSICIRIRVLGDPPHGDGESAVPFTFHIPIFNRFNANDHTILSMTGLRVANDLHHDTSMK